MGSSWPVVERWRLGRGRGPSGGPGPLLGLLVARRPVGCLVVLLVGASSGLAAGVGGRAPASGSAVCGLARPWVARSGVGAPSAVSLP